MAKPARGAERRDDALSRDRIIAAAIELLDTDGEDGLTFRTLAARLATGAGAIYWHVANKRELLAAAAAAVVTRAMDAVVATATPYEAIHGIAIGVFEAIDAHPWLGAQLSRAPWDTAMLQIFERVGREVEALGVPAAAQLTSVSALVSYIIGVSIQNAANGRLVEPAHARSRAEFLETESARWQELDAQAYRFTRNVAAQLREHDDVAEFLAGVDLILGGIAARPGSSSTGRPDPRSRSARRTPPGDRRGTVRTGGGRRPAPRSPARPARRRG